MNNIASLNEHFGKFGHVTNIQLQFDGSPDSALVTFSTRNEAQSAFSSTEPIFNNRFIKVFWHNPSPPATTTAGAVTTTGAVTTKPVVKHDPPAGTVVRIVVLWSKKWIQIIIELKITSKVDFFVINYCLKTNFE